jgi:predicted PurR-regulated permease PerM
MLTLREIKRSKMAEHGSDTASHGKYFFYFCLIASLVLVFLLFRPFLKTITLSLICAAVVFPVQRKLYKLFGRREALASLATCTGLIILIIVPIAILAYFFAQEATGFYSRLSGTAISEMKRHSIMSVAPAETIGNALELVVPGIVKPVRKETPKHKLTDKIVSYARQVLPAIQKSKGSVEAQAMDLAKTGLSFALKHAQGVISNVTAVILHFFLFLFTVFFFLKDGPVWLKSLSEIIPLADRQKELIFSRFKDVSISTVFGILFTAMLQGFISGIGFWIVGISPVLWGTAAAFAALIPMIGAALIWFPAGVYLIIDGNIKTGIFLLLWGGFFVSFLDNFYRPFLMRGTTEVSAVWILFSVLGGLSLFGFSGIFIGPLILSMAITMTSIYRDEYSDKV